tara:strand:+ start:76 stop:606 length:531 start_codon:yes stop_codon:yes gene_type:complete
MNTEEAPPSYEELQNYAPHQEIEKLKKQLAAVAALLEQQVKRTEAREQFLLYTDDYDVKLKCFKGLGEIINGKWVNECEACPDGDCECECDSEDEIDPEADDEIDPEAEMAEEDEDIDVVAINTEDWGIGIDTLYLDEETRIVYNPLDSDEIGEQLVSGCWIINGRLLWGLATVWR